MRRTWLHGRENVHERYLIHVAGHDLGILMRLPIGAGTPKEATARGWALLFVQYRADTLAIVVPFLDEAGPAILMLTVTAKPTIEPPTSSTGRYSSSGDVTARRGSHPLWSAWAN